MRNAPYFFDGTNRQWKQKKRAEWRAVTRAFDVFTIGCAYTPMYFGGRFDAIRRQLEEVRSELSRKNWGQ